MRDINLIPKSRYGFRDYIKFLLICVLIVSLSAFVIFFGVIDPLQRIRYAEQAFDIHTSQMERHKDVDVDNAALIARLDELKLRKEALSELFPEVLPKSVLMRNIDGAVPDRVSIDSLVYGNGTITFQGSAPSPIEVADFSIGLTRTGLFARVRIISIVRALEGGRHSFVILSSMAEVN
jgi:Tfp pilus assembly protein PilN